LLPKKYLNNKVLDAIKPKMSTTAASTCVTAALVPVSAALVPVSAALVPVSPAPLKQKHIMDAVCASSPVCGSCNRKFSPDENLMWSAKHRAFLCIKGCPEPGTTFISNFSAPLIGQICEFLDIEQLVALYLAMPEKMQYLKVLLKRRLRESITTGRVAHPAKLLTMLFGGGYVSLEHARELIDENYTVMMLIHAVPLQTLAPTMRGLFNWSTESLILNGGAKLDELCHQLWLEHVSHRGSLVAITGYYDFLLTMPYSENLKIAFTWFYQEIDHNNWLVYEDDDDLEGEEADPVLLLELLAYIWTKKSDCKKTKKTWYFTLMLLRRYLMRTLGADADELYDYLMVHTELTEASATDLVLYERKKKTQ